jgi:two-component system CheB/CheR fusion protein
MANKSEPTSVQCPSTIIAIGASAGGLEAINTFFDHATDMHDYAFIVVQHLSAEHKSFLVELVARHTSMRVLEAGENMPVEAGCVYVIPNKMMMTIRHRKLRLLEKTSENVPNNAIDVFFKSLADDQGKNAMVIILSGTGSDGTKSIDRIKENGGTVIVQTPVSARFDGMPNSAILTGNADVVLMPHEMPEWIKQQIRETMLSEGNDVVISEQEMSRVFDAVKKNGGHDFNYYRTPTIVRRVNKRMRQAGIRRLEDYLQLIENDKQEATRLSKDLLINVTRFFRDKEAFDLLYKKVIPAIVKNNERNDIIKIWVCACSTGEEAYSIALLFDKYLQEHNLSIQVKIFATDIDEKNVQIAAKNEYPLTIAQDIDPDLLQRYFIKEHKSYSVIPRIRKQIVFALHNVIKDPAFIKNDLISCRNMMIYMNKLLQEKILASFHFSLKDGGFLILGPSESAATLQDGFVEVNNKWSIYSKSNKKLSDIFFKKLTVAPVSFATKFKKAIPVLSQDVQLREDLQSTLINDLGFTALYIDHQYDIKEAVGDFSKYLSLPQTKLKFNILAMLPKEYRNTVASAVRKAWNTHEPVRVSNLLDHKSGSKIAVWVKPNLENNASLTLLVFGKMSTVETDTFEMLRSPQDASDTDYIKDLEAELAIAKDNLQQAIEGLETTNEELQSANEELLSSNEELQSSNEELQSLNEELHTLNVEHQAKIKELIELNDDLDNAFSSSDTGQVFLDQQLNIRRFNKHAARFVNLIEADISRSFSHISTNIQHADLLYDIKEVQRGNKIVEKEVSTLAGESVLLRIYPYLRKDKLNDGVVLTFTDISEIKKLYSVVDGVFNSSLNAIIVLSSVLHPVSQQIEDFKITAVNYAAENLIGKERSSILGLSAKWAAPHLINEQIWRKLIQVINGAPSVLTEFSLEDEGKVRSFDVSAVKLNEGVIVTFTDITQRKNAEKRLKRNYNELIAARESLKELNANLEVEVAARTKELSQSEERFRLVSRATNDVIKDWDLVNNRVWRSESFFNLFGYEHGDNQSVEFWFDKIHEEDLPVVKKELFAAINEGQPQWIAGYRFKHAHGHYCHVLERGYILKDDSGMPYRFISSMMDISALKKAEEATRDLMKRKDEFMSIASHELKTPITSMKASLQIIQRIIQNSDENAMIKGFIKKANDQVDKLTTLIENLLDVTKIQAGKIVFNYSEFAIGEVINDCVYQLQNTTTQKIKIKGNVQVTINADKNRIEQVVTNFLSNAIKYSPPDEEIIIECSVDNHQLVVQVHDKGIGISPENQQLVFDRFYREGASSKHVAGLGLGLYISADIIQRHNGTIGVQSELGKGSSFWFSLPTATGNAFTV